MLLVDVKEEVGAASRLEAIRNERRGGTYGSGSLANSGTDIDSRKSFDNGMAALG
jgi:hypothetical protein